MHIRPKDLAILSYPPIYPFIDINDGTLSKSLSYTYTYILIPILIPNTCILSIMS